MKANGSDRRSPRYILHAALPAVLLSGCSHSSQPTLSTPKTTVPSIVGNWSGKAAINPSMAYTASFTQDGAFTLNGSWQGVNGPAGQNMSGTFTQAGATVTLNMVHNDAIAAGQTTPMSPVALTGVVSSDGKSIDLGQGLTEYFLTRSE